MTLRDAVKFARMSLSGVSVDPKNAKEAYYTLADYHLLLDNLETEFFRIISKCAVRKEKEEREALLSVGKH